MICRICPRACNAIRTDEEGAGFCRMGAVPIVTRAALHFWEEPCISGSRGSGAIFFSGCSLGCAFCQNGEISRGGKGKLLPPAELRRAMDRLVLLGAHNINLVTASHFAPAVLEAIGDGPGVPVVWNSGGYESVGTLRMLEGRVQIYLPDLKFALPEAARRYANAPDYPERAKEAILEMARQVGGCTFDARGLLQKGVLVRHLVLPGNLRNTFEALDFFVGHLRDRGVYLSLMSQYTPAGPTAKMPPTDRRLTAREYETAVRYMEECGIENGFVQSLESANGAYVPAFDLTGL